MRDYGIRLLLNLFLEKRRQHGGGGSRSLDMSDVV